MHRLKQLWINLTSSLWFVPLGMVAASAVLAMGLTLIDVFIGTSWASHKSLLFGIGADGARGMLSAIAGSMMTVASLTFSLTISTLATASAQYTSRLVRNFMRDTVNQFVLGYFVSLFAYCLIVLRTIRGGDEGQFVPSLAVLGGLVLALLSIVVLIYFIHHIAESIQAATILENVTRETLGAIGKLFPANVGDPIHTSDLVSVETSMPESGPCRSIEAGSFGFVQSVDAGRLMKIGEEHDGLVRMRCDVGSFATPGGVLCEICSKNPFDESIDDQLRGTYTIGSARTIEQDAAFGIRQIVDIALKALSPGINDTTTGVMCVEHLGVLLEAIAVRAIPSELRATDGVVRVVASGRSYQALVELCLSQIRQSASGNTAVLTAMLRAIESAGRLATDPERRAELIRQAGLVRDLTASSVKAPADRDPILAAAGRTVAALQ